MAGLVKLHCGNWACDEWPVWADCGPRNSSDRKLEASFSPQSKKIHIT